MFGVDFKNCYWNRPSGINAMVYDCAFCSNRVSSSLGYYKAVHKDGSGDARAFAYICPECQALTMFDLSGTQFPQSVFANHINHLPNDINSLYSEACTSASINAHTASVMVSRKLLMNIAVSKGAKAGESFLFYVNFLNDKGYIPPDGKDWVDYIRQLGNEANHEIHLMGVEDSRALITFVEMLLKFIYEFPKKIPPPKKK